MDNTPLDANDLLTQYGGIDKHRLKDLLDAYEHDSNEIDLIQNSQYYCMNNLPNIFRTREGNFIILTLNVDGILSKIDELRLMVAIFGYQGIYIDVICIQESHLDNSFKSDTPCIQIDGYDCIPQEKYCGQKGGLITYVKSSYDNTKFVFGQRSDIWEGLYVEVKDNEGFRIMIGNIYKPPRNNNNNANIERFTNELKPILKDLENEKCDIALAGDWNINLLLMNEKLKFQSFFDELTNCSLFPKITYPTRIGNHSCTLIDNIFCKLTQNTIHSNAGIIYSNISDHFPCFVAFKLRNKKLSKQPQSLIKQTKSSPEAIENFKNDLLAHDFSKDLPSLLSEEVVDPNISYNIFIEKVIELKNKNMPTKFVKFNKRKHKKQPWMTEGILKSIIYRDKLLIKLRKLKAGTNGHTESKQNLKAYNSILKRSIREAKIHFYYNIFNKYRFDIRNTWKNINALISKSSVKEIKQLRINGTKIDDKQQITDEFNSFFSNIGAKLASSIDTHNKKPFNHFLKKNILTQFKFELFELEDTEKLIKSLKTKDSFGPDGISVKLIKSIADGILLPVTLILNQSLITGIFPDSLKIAKVIPLYKKEDRELPDNYRPVSLLNAMSKIFERAAYNQLYKYFQDNDLFYKHQYGFRTAHSTELASIELIDQIFDDLNKKHNPIAIYMDLSKAFDTLDHKVLISKLHYYGIRGVALEWFKNYLSNRQQYVELNGFKSSFLPLTTGVPQGSILGPLLFLIYMNDIPYSSDFFQFLLFADDTSLKTFINTKLPNFSVNETSNIINGEIQKVHDWLAVNKLSLNVKKTKFMVFYTSNKNITPFIPSLKIGGKSIERVQDFNFLGLTINEKMSWKSHVNKISNKVSKYVGVLNRLKRYLPGHILKIIYVSLIQSNLNYALMAWGFNCGRLKKIQKKAIRIICGSKYLGHSTPLMKQIGILRLEDMFKLNMLKWYFKYTHKQLPKYFLEYEIRSQGEIHDHNTRGRNHISQPVPRLHGSKRCLRHYIPSIINATPKTVIDKIHTHSFQGFSRYAKTYYLSQYSTECLIHNCYSCNST